MREEIEALGRLVDIASEVEIGLAEQSRLLQGEAKERAERLTALSDGLADSLTAIYISLAKYEVEHNQDKAVKSAGSNDAH